MSTVPESAEDPGPVIEPDMEDESWFWSDENQEGYREALEDLEHGRYRDFDHVDDLITHLKRPV